MSRSAAASIRPSGADARSAEWLSGDQLRDALGPLMSAGSHQTGQHHPSARPAGARRPRVDSWPRSPPKSAGPECTRPSDLRSNGK